MNNSTMNFEASTNSTHDVLWALTNLDLCMFTINLLFGLPTHSYVLWLIATGTSGVASDFFIFNLSVCEIGVCLNSLLSIASYCTMLSHLTVFVWFSLGLLITGRPLFDCLMCVERYLAVVHPVTFLKYKPLRYRAICCAVAWIIIIVSCLCCMFTAVLSKISIYIYSIQFLLFFFIQLFCLVAVLRALKQSGPGERAEENHVKRKAFNLVLKTTVTMCAIYMPFIVSGFSFVLMQLFILDFFSFGNSCFILGGFVQPVLYLHRAGKLSCPSCLI